MRTPTKAAETGTRDRILAAASELARGEKPLTVRGVAARAGVGMGTLRHHFPTQRALLDAVLASVYEVAMPDERIRDTTLPAAERLLECLRPMLAGAGIGDAARATLGDVYRSFVAPEASEESRAGYAVLHRQAARRVQSWLSILVEEGALDPGDNSARAEFLIVVVNGLALQRALPSAVAPLDLENSVLRTAIGALPIVERNGAR